ncbi:MAG: Ig-like domain-containing protein, partial [Flavobacteriales bacterium]
DCGGSNQLCSDSQVSGASSGFGTQDLNAANNGCLGLEHQSNWFYAQVTTAGAFSFSIMPQAFTDDYDFAVWQYPAGSSVPCPPTADPIRCSYSSVDGATGLGNGATDLSEGAAGNGWVAPINVSVGDILVILIDNFSSTTTPFTMDFTGTASLNCTPVPLECSISGMLQACVGATSQLTGTGTPAASNAWISSDATVASVSSTGLVSGVAAGSATITYTDSQGCQVTQLFTVNPRPSIGHMATQMCSASTFNEVPTSDAPNVLPLGTMYSWVAPTGNGFTGGVGGSGSSISGNLVNSGLVPVVATYAVTATSGVAPNQCSGTFNLEVTVNPRPAITAMNRTICTGQQFSATPVNGVNGMIPTGTIFSWSA